MFPTFTGSSRRPRNVNLSGQKHINPFAAHPSFPSAAAGASKTVADAQAGRQKRQQERNELKAARAVQRVWRGHRVRRSVKLELRHVLGGLYSGAADLQPDERAAVAFPLFLASFSKGDDCQLLDRFAEDLSRTDYRPLASGQIPKERLWRLAQILIYTLAQ